MPTITLPAPDPVSASGLLEDFQTAGVAVDSVDVADGIEPAVVISGGFTIDDWDEIVAVIQAHDGQPSNAEATDVDAETNIDAAIAKARQVWRGEASYTTTEAQKTIAGLVLYVTR